MSSGIEEKIMLRRNVIILAIATYFSAMVGTVFCKSHVHICGRSNHNGSTGELMPHNGIIPAGHDCTWHIYPDSFNIPEVFMVIEDFRMAEKDRFIIRKHDGDRLFGPFNGTKDTFTILTGFLMLDVTVDVLESPPEERHFKSYFTTNDCYYLIEEESGMMTSPLYNNVDFRKTVTCKWQFRKFKQVTLPRTVTFKTFNLINSTLTVQGSKSQDGIYSGTKLPDHIVAFGETQFILKLNTSIPGETFSFEYGLNALNTPSSDNHLLGLDPFNTSLQNNLKAPRTACGIINFQGLNGLFGPKHSAMNAYHTCMWTIQSGPVQQSPGIYIVIEESYLLSNDTFIVHQHSTEKTLFGPYTGKKGLFSMFTDETSVEVSLETSNSKPFIKRHFRGYYSTAGCDYTITNNVGILHSPIYKAKDQKKTACSWKFNQQNASSIISITFDNYNIKTSQLQVQGSMDQDQIYKGSDGPFDILMRVYGTLTLEIDRSSENETLSFSYNTVTPACSKYIKIIEKESIPLSLPPPGLNCMDPFNCLWIVEGSKENVLAIYVEDIHLADPQDLLLIKDGKTRTSPKLIQVTESSQDNIKGNYVVSSTNTIWISFSTQFPFKGSQFKINVNISEEGGHLHNEQNFTITPPKSGVDVIFYLDVEKDKQVLLNLLPKQQFPSTGAILVYDGFTVNAPLLATMKHNKRFYPIIATGSNMKLVAKGFDKGSSVNLTFKGVTRGCHQVTLDQHGTYALSGNCNLICSWAILPKLNDSQEMLSLHLSSLALRPADVIEVKQLDDNMTHICTVTLQENHMPNIYLPAAYGAYIRIKRGLCSTAETKSTAFSASVEILKSCSVSIDIKAGEKIYLTSPNYPDTYPFNSRCHWNVSTRAKNLYVSFKDFQLADGHCLKIYEIDNEHIVDTITYESSVVPSDKMLRNSISFELIASKCTKVNSTSPTSGNGFLVEVFSLDCGGTLGKEMKGTFSTPDFPNSVAGNIICIWKIEVPANNSDGSVNVISYDIEWSAASTDDERGLTIHDGPSLSSEVFSNTTTTVGLMSKRNTVVFIYQQNNSIKSHAALKVDFESRAGNSLCDNGLYMHPDWVCDGINDCGDYSDEKNCKGHAPLPPPVPPLPPNINITKSGVSKVVVGCVVPAAFVIGIISTIVTASIIREVKRCRENSYDTLPILP